MLDGDDLLMGWIYIGAGVFWVMIGFALWWFS
jgi:hypothetical protein